MRFECFLAVFVSACLLCVIFVGLVPVGFVSAQGVTWTYNAGTNTASAAGAGSTNFAALVAADVAGGWGKYTVDATGTQVKCAGRIVAGDNTNALTWTDTNLQVTFISGATSANGQNLIAVGKYATVTFGAVADSATKSTKQGVSFLSLENTRSYLNFIGAASTSNVTVNLYSCTFASGLSSAHSVWVSNGKVWNCVFNGYTNLALANYGGVDDVYNIVKTGGSSNLDFFSSGNTVNKVVSLYPTRYLRFEAAGTASNVFGRGATVVGVRVDTTSECYVINGDLDLWTFAWNSAGKVTRQYEYDLQVLNGEITDFVEDANVTLTKNGVQVGTWLTNSSGQISTQILTYGFYNSTGGNSIYEGSYPFVLTITHADWANYTSRFYVTEKTRMTVSMQEVVSTTPDPSVYMLVDDSQNWQLIFAVFGVVVGCVVGLWLFAKRKIY